MLEYTITGRRQNSDEKIMLVVVYSQYYADYWVSIYESEGWLDIEILINEG
jgi:hypothetical protein